MILEKNYIKKVAIDISLGDQGKAMHLKSKASKLANGKLFPIIEEVLDEFSRELQVHEFLQISRLNLELEHSDSNLESMEFLSHFKTELRKKIREQILKSKHIFAQNELTVNTANKLEFATDFEGRSMHQDGNLLAQNESNSQSVKSDFQQLVDQLFQGELLQESNRVLRTFLHVLQSGSKPWWITNSADLTELFHEDKLMKMLDEHAEIFARLLPDLLREESNRKRLVFQFSNSFLLRLLYCFSGFDLQSAKKQLEKQGFDQLFSTELNREARNLVLLDVMTFLSEKNSFVEFDPKTILTRLEALLHPQSEWDKRSLQEKKVLEEVSLFYACYLDLNGTKNTAIFRNRIQEELKQRDLEQFQKHAQPEISHEAASKKDRDDFENDQTNPLEDEFHASRLREKQNGVEEQIPNHRGTKQDETNGENSDLSSLEAQQSVQSQKTVESEQTVENSNKENSMDARISPNKNQNAVENPPENLSDESLNIGENANDHLLKFDDSDPAQAPEIRNIVQGAEADEASNSMTDSAETSSPAVGASQDKSKKSDGDSRIDMEQVEGANDSSLDLLKKAQKNGVLVENAGLILLNPFFKHLFKNCGLLNDEQKITNATLAVHTLHYAATGTEFAPDYALLFEKYLVGIPMGLPIERELELPEHIKNEVGLMFEALKQNWSIMSGSSDALIRNEYIKRNGKLFIESDTHRLVVKRTTIDLLIDKIPWTISMVQLPWKKEMLYTDW